MPTTNTIPPACPRCGAPRTADGQPSRRWFYACGSFLYEGDRVLCNTTELCEVTEAMNDAASMFNKILRDKANAKRLAKKWLNAYAPHYL